MFKRKRSIDLLYNNLNILITELYLELVRCMFIYIDFYHNAKTLLIFFKGTYWLRLLGCLIVVDPASQTPGSHLLAHFWIFISHSLHLSCSLLCFFLSFSIDYFFLCTLVLFSSVAHGLFYASCREWREAANNSNFKSFQKSNPVGKGEVFLTPILKHNERILVSIVLALCQIFHGLHLDAHLSHKGQSVWLTTSRELHEFKEEHFSNGGGGVLSSVEGQKWFKTDKKLSHVFSYWNRS